MDFSYSAQEESFWQSLRNWLEENLPSGWVDGQRELPKEDKAYALFLRDW